MKAIGRTRTGALAFAVALLLSGIVLVGGAGTPAATAAPTRASFYWAANAWGECNTARPPVPAEYSYLYFNGVVVPAGFPANYYWARCKYTAVAYRGFQTVLMRRVNWSRACWLDAAGYRYRVSYWYGQVWCVLG